MMSEMDVNAIAGTLKLYFRELPEPLFTDEFYPNFAEGIGERRRHRPRPSRPRCPSTMVCISVQTLCVVGGPRTKPVLEGPCPSSRGLSCSPDPRCHPVSAPTLKPRLTRSQPGGWCPEWGALGYRVAASATPCLWGPSVGELVPQPCTG